LTVMEAPTCEAKGGIAMAVPVCRRFGVDG